MIQGKRHTRFRMGMPFLMDSFDFVRVLFLNVRILLYLCK